MSDTEKPVAKGPLIILSGPSGSGKSTLVRRLLDAEGARLRLSVSATTRTPRIHESDGKQYHFWTRQRFDDEIRADSFLEYADVFGHSYGTPISEVDPHRQQGEGVLLEIDVQGAEQVRRKRPDAVSVFLKAPSMAIYEERLRRRGTESEEVIQRRLAGARREEARAGEFDYVVVNDDLETALQEVRQLVQSSFTRSTNA